MLVDPFKVAHWANARKYTVEQLAQRAGMSLRELRRLLTEANATEVPDWLVSAIAAALDLSTAQIAAQTDQVQTVICQTAEQLTATKRALRRDGIHFYNYYTMAAPPNHVAPVILDILCPAGRLPALNNGHLEPAITVNLGPGDIHGRWGAELSEETWHVLRANRGDDRWITGDSYVEPSFCPHSYSLTATEPARIVSYTGHANLAPLIERLNTWSAPAFARSVEAFDTGLHGKGLLDLLLAARGHDRRSAAEAARIEVAQLEAAIVDPLVNVAVLRQLGRTVGLDYRVLLPAERRHDGVGKTCATLEQARASVRSFNGYRVASMASAPHLPDLIGLFMQIPAGATAEGHMAEPAETHYLVIEGTPSLEWTDGSGASVSMALHPDASAWVGPFVRHRLHGGGAVLKLSSGAHVNYLDLMELTNTYQPGATVRRGRQDLSGWGYD